VCVCVNYNFTDMDITLVNPVFLQSN